MLQLSVQRAAGMTLAPASPTIQALEPQAAQPLTDSRLNILEPDNTMFSRCVSKRREQQADFWECPGQFIHHTLLLLKCQQSAC